MNQNEAKEFDTFSYSGDMDYILESSASQRIDEIFAYFNYRSCESCIKYKGNVKKDCKLLAFEFKRRLKDDGYLMMESEFYCPRYEVKF